MLRKGVPVSPGVAVGAAYCILQVFVDPQGKPLEESEVVGELERYDLAREKTIADLKALYQKVATQVSPENAEIFRVHQSILNDKAFTTKVRDRIFRERTTARAALAQVMADYTSLFARTKDEYLKERLADVRDVIVRLSGHLSQVLEEEGHGPTGPLIVVADELLPSHVVLLGERQVVGIVTEAGGQTSHAAILARSRGIPAVSGAQGILRQVRNGDTVVVDGREGVVVVNPDPESEAAYRKLQREFVDLKDHLAENRDMPAVDADGQPLELLANINSVADCQAATAMGASGIGLFRTEYLFLTHPDVPDEEEQIEAYREVIHAAPNHRVTIRTLDLGGDKTIPYLGHRREANPFLGWRSIRLSFEHPEFFLKQIRAVLRAAAPEPGINKQVRLMFPMITTVVEMQRVRRMVRRACRDLDREGKPRGEVAIGMMVEVPAAAITIDAFLPLVDFVSIGSNDLIQYLMAADRDNPKVNHLCQPLGPAVIKVLHHVISTCNKRGKPVTLCGEMAGAPRSFLLLYAMGLRSFSMSPAFIPSIKTMAGCVHREAAERILRRAMQFKTTDRVRQYMAKQVLDICPSIKLLDSP